MLKFNKVWRVHSPGPLDQTALSAFHDYVGKLCNQGQRWGILELFKRYFASAAGFTSSTSSSESWAESDLHNYMGQAAESAPLFIEAFHDACVALQEMGDDIYAPDVLGINKFLAEQKIPYRIQSSELVFIGDHHTVDVPVSLPSFEEQAQDLIRKSFREADNLLAEGRPRQAVQETLWLLETISTAFQGLDFDGGSVEGKYFNKIVDDLKRHNKGKVIEQVLVWVTNLHGYLSSPKGGGVRHGTNLKDGIEIQLNEGRLFCNLIRSYITFMLEEHARLTRGN